MTKKSKTELIFNLNKNLVNQTQFILGELRLSQTTAVTIFYKKIVAEGELPFDVLLTDNQKKSGATETAEKEKHLPFTDADLPPYHRLTEEEWNAYLDDVDD